MRMGMYPPPPLLAQLRRQPKPARTLASALKRPAGRDPAPQRALTDIRASRRRADLARTQLNAVASREQIGHEPTAGCLSQQPSTVVLVVA
jgi:hypothetical protein